MPLPPRAAFKLGGDGAEGDTDLLAKQDFVCRGKGLGLGAGRRQKRPPLTGERTNKAAAGSRSRGAAPMGAGDPMSRLPLSVLG